MIYQYKNFIPVIITVIKKIRGTIEREQTEITGIEGQYKS